MEALLIALAVIAVLVVTALIGGLIAETTGYEVSEWLGWLFGNAFLLCAFGGGVYLMLWGIRLNNVLPILVGFFITASTGGILWHSIKHGPGE